MNFTDFLHDISCGEVREAFCGVSHEPERMADDFMEGYAKRVAAFHEELFAAAQGNPEREKEANEFFDEFRTGLCERATALLRATGRTMSPMVTGRSQFPTEQNAKRLETERKWREEYDSYHGKMMGRVLRHWGVRKTDAVMAGDADAVEKVERKLEVLKGNHARMKNVNALIRAAKRDDGKAAAAIKDAYPAMSHADIARLLVVDPRRCQYRQGYQDYELTNSNANIRRYEVRLKLLKAAKMTEDGEVELDGLRIVVSSSENRVKLFFDGKPDDAMRSMLKIHGFRWAPTEGCWKGYLNNHSLAFTQILKRDFSL